MNYIKNNQNQKQLTIFLEDDLGKIVFHCNNNDSLLSLFNQYIRKRNKYNQNLSFLYGGRILKQYMTIDQAHIENLNVIRVLDSNYNLKGGGGFCLNFTDLSKQIYEEYNFSYEAPNYRSVGKGMNICGECKTEKCEAYNLEVIVPLNQIQEFNLIKKRTDLKCPLCKGLIEPKTVAFYLCGYKVRGKNFENGNVKSFEFYGKASNKEAVQYYSPIKNGETLVIELIIEITNYF